MTGLQTKVGFELRIDAPSDKQRAFFLARQKYVGYGGARGGGKSWAIRTKAVLLCLRYPGIKVMIVRRTYPELTANHILPLRELLGAHIARYHEQRKEYRFSSGSTITFRYCASEKDMGAFQGLEIDALFLDEATQMDERVFQMLTACVRGTNAFPKRFYLTCNPGGRGHAWFKRLFIDRSFKESENPDEYTFIQALPQDNAALMRAQPDYIDQLKSLPHSLREAWLYGKWDVFSGQVFAEWRDVPEEYATGVGTHVIDPIDIPAWWPIYRGFDFGYSKPFACYWASVSPDERIYVIRELYGIRGDEADAGAQMEPREIAERIRRIEHESFHGREIIGIADPAIFAHDRGESIAQIMAGPYPAGVIFSKGDHRRLPGLMQVHRRLAFGADGRPMLQVFSTCKHLIRTLPALVYDERDVEDVDTSQEDHAYDALRYILMARPMGAIDPASKRAPKPKLFDPLDIATEEDFYARYAIR
ncbi:MAG: phage terminase large subunit [Christensenellaceae bacterium]|jgi:phage terminase large subunit|nr:phage terminase large subunit [Christensenellaceae bacterium]